LSKKKKSKKFSVRTKFIELTFKADPKTKFFQRLRKQINKKKKEEEKEKTQNKSL